MQKIPAVYLYTSMNQQVMKLNYFLEYWWSNKINHSQLINLSIIFLVGKIHFQDWLSFSVILTGKNSKEHLKVVLVQSTEVDEDKLLYTRISSLSFVVFGQVMLFISGE